MLKLTLPIRVLSWCLSFLFLAVVLGTVRDVFADSKTRPGSRGRDREGKPYRIDEQGVRLTDHIAELEVEVDELRGRVFTLEEELGEKDKLISRLSGEEEKLPKGVTESDVLPPANSQPTDCNSMVSSLQMEIRSLEARLAAEQKKSEQLGTPTAPLPAAALGISPPPPFPPIPSLSQLPLASLQPPSVPATSITPEVKQRLELKLATINQLISKRKSLIDTLKAKNNKVSVTPARLATKRGVTLDALRLGVARNATSTDAVELERSLDEIALVLREDIKLFERLNG